MLGVLMLLGSVALICDDCDLHELNAGQLDVTGATAIGHCETMDELKEAMLANNADLDKIRLLATAPGTANHYLGHVVGKRAQPAAGSPDVPAALTSFILLAASAQGKADVVRLLLDSGADVDSRQVGGHTALIAAASNGHSNVVEVLLDRGAQADLRGGHAGRTALMEAAVRGRVGVVRLLLDHGADVELTDDQGRTALQLAVDHAHADVVTMLYEDSFVTDPISYFPFFR